MGETRTEKHPFRGDTMPQDPARRRIGRYRLERLLGRGGMGEVYLAVRTDDFEKQVALKLIRRDADPTEVDARLRAERQILARLEHPSIARILDGGTTDEGRPYLVMEYVEGEPFDRHCQGGEIGLRRRLELFLEVCDAVAAAHRQLVVHRDLKPSNILVTDQNSAGKGSVKLLDFGIATILDPPLSETAGFERAASESASEGIRPRRTAEGPSPMTPAWASPEQLTGDAITTLGDVYSLGTVLYHLLTGRHPFHSGEGGWALVQRICSAEAPPPSVVAGDRSLAGDLDAIVAKSMRKRPEDRYGSVEQLSEDLGRHLDGLPVSARRGGWAYRVGKLVRRHKLAVAVLLLVLAVGVATHVLWWRAERQRAEAVRQRQRAESVAHFLGQLFRDTPVANETSTISVRQLLDRGRQRLTRDLEALPEVRAELAGILGNVYTDLGLYDEGHELLAEAVRSRRAHRDDEHTELAVDINNLGKLFYRVGDHAAAERSFREALAIRRRLGHSDAERAVVLSNLASILSLRGAYDEAESLYRQLLTIREQAFGAEDPRVGSILYSLGSLHYRRGDPAAAEPLLRRALTIRRRAYGDLDTRVATVGNSLGRVLLERGDRDRARPLLEQALTVRRNLLGDEHPHVAVTRRDLAVLYLESGDLGAAGDALEAALAVLRQRQPVDEIALATTESVYGAWLLALGRPREAEPYLVASHRTLLLARGERSVYTRAAARRLAALDRARERSGVASE